MVSVANRKEGQTEGKWRTKQPSMALPLQSPEAEAGGGWVTSQLNHVAKTKKEQNETKQKQNRLL